MGSLRNPVGPLPSSIYWRRRAVLLSVLALLALLATWSMTSGGGGRNNADGANGKNPAPSITPGPSGSGPAISEHPGGRDESGGGDGGGSGSGGDSGGGSGSGDPGGSGDSAGGGSDDGANGSGSGGGGTGTALPVGSTLPNCTAGAMTLTLSSVRNTYTPDQTPAFRIVAKNSSGNDCKVDLGPRGAVVTVTQAGNTDAYWSSDDCPKGASHLLYRVPADSSITYTVKWDRRPSAPECGTPPAGSATPGTYLVEAKAPGYTKAQTSFVLSAD
ncbi:hypothetical protein JS756_29190 [Streptomyces actuosus]|uniref:DUF4232 domain-containing protein n=1 Tax=Streptomyces actuosus TaxID=1885 RepID=A0ABS2VYJ4_STRAS|nr:hypothetical protein [Streptomyces actuosus]MBN0048113.1 hypothetical protein [Streptomyces actuosus]